MVSDEQFEALCEDVKRLEQRMGGLEKKVALDILRVARSLAKSWRYQWRNYVLAQLTGPNKTLFIKFSQERQKQFSTKLDKATSVDEIDKVLREDIKECEDFLKASKNNG